jgi:hypothetical protein
MKKILFSAIVIATSLTAFSQVNGRIAKSSDQTIYSTNTVEKTNAVSTITCGLISTQTSNSVTINTAATGTACPGGGFVNGTNCYGDVAKSNYFPATSFSSITSPSIAGVSFGFYKSPTRGVSGTVKTVTCSIYNGSMVSGPTGAALATATASLSQIIAAQTSTTNSFFLYPFVFTTPISAPVGGFFAAITIPTTAGDTIVIFNQTAATTNYGWEKQSDNIWYDMGSASGWGTAYKANLAVYPNICGNWTVGLSENLGLSNNVKVLPNPTSGLVNVVFTLANEENVVVSVSNTLGQVVSNSKFDGISNKMVSLDIANQPNGVYFVTISNGKDKMVQRLILNK